LGGGKTGSDGKQMANMKTKYTEITSPLRALVAQKLGSEMTLDLR
jgi:hypothetical protein